MNDEILNKVVEDISYNHHKIIDDWCKAYLAQLYQENGSIKPGDFTLVQQSYDFKSGKIGYKYWFEKSIKEKDE